MTQISLQTEKVFSIVSGNCIDLSLSASECSGTTERGMMLKPELLLSWLRLFTVGSVEPHQRSRNGKDQGYFQPPGGMSPTLGTSLAYLGTCGADGTA